MSLILPHAKQCHELFKGMVTKGATREVLQYTYLLIVSGGGVEGGCLAPRITFAVQDVGKNAKQKTNHPNRYFTGCRKESTAQQQT